MKTSTDSRHKKRGERISTMYANSFTLNFSTPFDQLISKAAPEWPIKSMNRIDLAILRVATEELLNSSTPEKVVIDEAVEFAKSLGAESSPSFVNGVLGTILKQKQNI